MAGGRARLGQVGLALAVAVSVACQTPPPAPPPESLVTPLELEQESQPILFKDVIFRIPSGKLIGGWYRGINDRLVKEIRWNSNLGRTVEFNVAGTDRLLERGYNAVDPAGAMFTDEPVATTRFKLGGVVKELTLNAYFDSGLRRGYAISELSMDVQLFDSAVREIVFSRQYTGWGLDEGRDPRALSPAVLNAFDKALADPEFAAIVIGPPAAVLAAGEPVAVPRCADGPYVLPRDLESAREAVVTVRAGSGSGSAVIVSSEGHALTAAHVVQGLKEVQVLMPFGVRLPAEVVRIDKPSDAALLRISGSEHRCIAIEEVAALDVGSEVFAIGSPLGEDLPRSVTRGIVSGRPELDGLELIQTDASVNLGNSGGPLLDNDGRIVGIVVQKALGIGIEGTAFALPIDTATERLAISWD